VGRLGVPLVRHFLVLLPGLHPGHLGDVLAGLGPVAEQVALLGDELNELELPARELLLGSGDVRLHHAGRVVAVREVAVEPDRLLAGHDPLADHRLEGPGVRGGGEGLEPDEREHVAPDVREAVEATPQDLTGLRVHVGRDDRTARHLEGEVGRLAPAEAGGEEIEPDEVVAHLDPHSTGLRAVAQRATIRLGPRGGPGEVLLAVVVLGGGLVHRGVEVVHVRELGALGGAAVPEVPGGQGGEGEDVEVLELGHYAPPW